MIEGLVPLITLWVIVVSSAAFLVLHSMTHWWRTEMAQHLFWYAVVTLAWYGEILAASYLGYPLWAQGVQAVTFVLVAGVLVWRVAIQVRLLFFHRREDRGPTRRGH